jgi:hypothetical protein
MITKIVKVALQLLLSFIEIAFFLDPLLTFIKEKKEETFINEMSRTPHETTINKHEIMPSLT